MFAVTDMRVDRKRTKEYLSLEEAMSAINHAGPAVVTGISGSIRCEGRKRQRFTYDGEWVVLRDKKYADLRTLIRNLPDDAILSRLHVTFVCGSRWVVKLRLTEPLSASGVYP